MTVQTVLIAALAFLAGCVVGHYLRDLIDLARRWCVRHTSRESTMNRPTVVTSQRIQGVAVALAVVLLLVEGLLLIRTRQQTAEYTQCTATWQQQFSASYEARTAAAQEASTALDDVIAAVYARDPAKFKAAISEYVAVRDRQDQARVKNPLPAPPDEVCGKPGGS